MSKGKESDVRLQMAPWNTAFVPTIVGAVEVTINEAVQSQGSSISGEVRGHTQRHQAPLFRDMGNFRLTWPK